ncbi:hypothetical protein [Achromobacter pestifer]|nr:hypothetical protein [Achromobacter pestifer]
MDQQQLTRPIYDMIKPMTVRRILLAFAALALSPAISAQTTSKLAAWTPPGPTACSFSSWTTDVKPAIQVRAAASAQAAVVGSLPTTRGDGPDPNIDYYSVTFDVTEARDGWLKIRNASDDKTGDEQSKPRPVYRGEGWIEAGDAQVGIQSARGYARPDAGSERLLDLGGDWLTERATLRGIVACEGEWLLLDYEMRNSDKFEPLAPKDRTRGRAWFRGICSSSETTCDMRSVDK